MGIQDVWTSLAPFCERKPLYTLEGQAVAIDLSCWIVEGQTAFSANLGQGQHLRNVFYRTIHLLTLNVKPIFVLEGEAPELKYKTIAERNAARKNERNDKIAAPATKSRTRFNFLLKQCAQMLQYMGLTCIRGKGEAEATCAYLNAKGLVSGVISQDSDCFAYGARIVYRNYSKAENKIDVYDLSKAKSFGQNKIIVLALLCGSDYNSGVAKVGRESVQNFLRHFKDDEVIDRIRSWKSNPEFYNEWDRKIRNKTDKTFTEEFRARMKNELQIRSKALQDPKFPNKEIIKEFLVPKDNIEKVNLEWCQPDLLSLVNFTSDKFGWKKIDTFQKVLPIFTYWQLKNYQTVAGKLANNRLSDLHALIFPKQIKNRKTQKGIACYEIQWEDKKNFFSNLIPSSQIKTTYDDLWVTVEKSELMDLAHPDLIRDFEEKIRQEKLAKRKNTNTKKPGSKKTKTQASIKEMLAPSTSKENPANASFDLNCSTFSSFSEDDAADISIVVNRIVSRPQDLLKNIEKLKIPCSSTTTMEALGAQFHLSMTKRDFSEFILETSAQILQEVSAKTCSSPEMSSDDTIIEDDNIIEDDAIIDDAIIDDAIIEDVPDLDDIIMIDDTSSDEKTSADQDCNDTFDEPYIPLMQRLKKK